MNPYVSKSIKDSVKVKKIIHYLCFELTHDYVDTEESHDFWEFVYMESGKATFECDGKIIKLCDNDILFHKPDCKHIIKSIDTDLAKMHFVSFESKSEQIKVFDELKTALPYRLKRELFLLFEKANQTFTRVVENKKDFLQMSENAPLGGDQLYKMYLEGFLIKLLRTLGDKSQSNTKQVKSEFEYTLYKKMVDKLNSNIFGNYTVSDLCKELNYGKTYLSEIFKKYSDTSIMNYYNMQKIEQAKKLIDEDKYTLSQISDILKYNNQYYFSRVFKKYEGVSPSEYKRSIKI